jgi:hypothetical protein
MQNLNASDGEHDAAPPLSTPVSRDAPARPDASHLNLVEGNGFTEPAADGRPWSVRSMLLLAGGVSAAIWAAIGWSITHGL